MRVEKSVTRWLLRPACEAAICAGSYYLKVSIRTKLCDLFVKIVIELTIIDEDVV